MKNKINKKDFLENPIYGKNITFTKKHVYIDEKKIYPYINKYVLSYIGLIIGMFFSVTLLVLNNIRVKDIKFNADYPINKLIEEDIINYTNNILTWRFLNENLVDINYFIKGKYPMYEWIGINKDNNTIYVTISNNKTKEKEIINIDKNIIAKKDGLVKQYVVFEGTSKVEYNMPVKRGDILISNEIQATRGYVLAQTFEEVTLKIEKKNINTKYTGNVSKYKSLNIFGLKLNFNYKNNYQLFEEKENRIIGIDNIFSFSDIYIYEKSDIIDVYEKSEVKNLIYSYLDDCFKKSLKEEKIEEIIYLSEEETKEYMIYKVLIKKIENIGVYE